MSRVNINYVSGRELFSAGIILFIFYIWGPDMGMREPYVNTIRYISLGCFALSVLLNAVGLHLTIKNGAPHADKVKIIIHLVLASLASVLTLFGNSIFQ